MNVFANVRNEKKKQTSHTQNSGKERRQLIRMEMMTQSVHILVKDRSIWEWVQHAVMNTGTVIDCISEFTFSSHSHD